MKVGICFANIMQFVERDGLEQVAVGSENAGFESLWTVEHVVYPEGYGSSYPYDSSGKMPADSTTPMPDPLIWLATAGALTSTIKLATGILIVPERNPMVLSKELASLDLLTNGRMMLGIGVGWLREEFDALGISWPHRGARTDDYIDVMRKLWTGELVSHHSDFVNFDRISSNPRPANGTVPIIVGGHTRKAAERAARIGDGFYPAGGDLAELSDIVRQEAAKHNRDPAAIEITYGPTDSMMGADPAGAVEELAAQGVDRAIFPSYLFLNDTVESLAAMGDQLGLEPAG